MVIGMLIAASVLRRKLKLSRKAHGLGFWVSSRISRSYWTPFLAGGWSYSFYVR